MVINCQGEKFFPVHQFLCGYAIAYIPKVSRPILALTDSVQSRCALTIVSPTSPQNWVT
jgi:hypothetical protein